MGLDLMLRTSGGTGPDPVWAQLADIAAWLEENE